MNICLEQSCYLYRVHYWDRLRNKREQLFTSPTISVFICTDIPIRRKCIYNFTYSIVTYVSQTIHDLVYNFRFLFKVETCRCVAKTENIHFMGLICRGTVAALWEWRISPSFFCLSGHVFEIYNLSFLVLIFPNGCILWSAPLRFLLFWRQYWLLRIWVLHN